MLLAACAGPAETQGRSPTGDGERGATGQRATVRALAAATVARRAGRTHTGPLTAGDGCVFEGSVPLDGPGRWFVYLEFTDSEGQMVEAWLPVTPPEPTDLQATTEQKDVWAYHPAGA